MHRSQPALKSGTVKTGLALILITIWKPLVMIVGVLLLFAGLDVDTAAWIPYADDGRIVAAEWLAIARDVVLPVLGLLVIRFRARATKMIGGWFGASGGAGSKQ